jgi:hypothetical protein
MRLTGQKWEMFRDMDAGDIRADGGELASNFGRRIRFHVESFVLSKAAGEEDVNDRSCFCGHGVRRIEAE